MSKMSKSKATPVLSFIGVLFVILFLSVVAYSVVKDPSIPKDITEVELWSGSKILALQSKLKCYNKRQPSASTKFRKTCNYLDGAWERAQRRRAIENTRPGNEAVKDIILPEE